MTEHIDFLICVALLVFFVVSAWRGVSLHFEGAYAEAASIKADAIMYMVAILIVLS